MPDDEDFNLPNGWDLDAPFSQGENVPLSDIASQYGWSDFRDIIAPTGDYTDDMVRPGVYFSFEDAIGEADNVGILDFTRVIFAGYDDEEETIEMWLLVVDHDSGGGT